MNRRGLGVIVGVAVVGIAVALLLSRGTSQPATTGQGRAGGTVDKPGRTSRPPAARGSIRGHVTDANGPVAQASVCASTTGAVQTCATTDVQGAYTIDDLGSTTYRVTALAAQHRPATFGFGTPTGSWLALGPGEARMGIDLVLRAGVLLSGVVQDINAGPIAGATVRVQTAGGVDMFGETRRFWSPPVVSGKDGEFQLWVEPGQVDVTAAADGYGESSVKAEAPTAVVILLTPEASIVGTVVDASGQPVRDAIVTARSFAMTAETVSGADGTFTVAGLAASEFTVTARTSHGFGALERVAAYLGKQTSVQLQLLAASRLRGVVMLGDTPCPEPHVGVRDPRTGRERAMIDDGSGGQVHIDGLLPGEYVVHPKFPGGYESDAPYARVVVTEKDQEGLVWRVNPGASIQGRVTNEAGAPVADVDVKASGASREGARTDENGTYEIRGLRAGDYAVKAEAFDGGRVERPLTLGQLEAKVVDLQMQSSARIAGTLVDAAGRPVTGLEIRADPKEKERSRGTSLSAPEVSSTGAFDLPVQPGAYHVYAAVDWSHPISPGVDVTVAAGQRVNVQIKVPAQDGVIKGKVVDEKSNAVNDAVVTASIPNGYFGGGFTLGWNKHPVLTDADGTFTVTGLGAGEYTVSAQRPGAPVASVKGVTPGSTVTLTIVAPSSLAGTVAYPDGRRPRELVVAMRAEANTYFHEKEFLGTNGAFHLDQVASGSFTLTVTDPDRGFVSTTLTLAPGESKKDLALALQPMVEIHGRLVDATTKQPLAGQIVLADSASSVVRAGSFYDDFHHTTAADGTFRFTTPTGTITVRASRFDMAKRERCQAEKEKTIDGPSDVGDLELACRKL